jgi:hypothetical protein
MVMYQSSPVLSDPHPSTPLCICKLIYAWPCRGEITPCKIYSKSTCQPGANDIRKQTANASWGVLRDGQYWNCDAGIDCFLY